MNTEPDLAPLSTYSVADLSNADDINLIDKEKLRFTKHSALITLLIMSIGPLSLVFQAVGETVDMAMISSRFKSDPNSHAMEIIGFTNQIYGMVVIFGMYFGQSLTTRISHLIGSGERTRAAYLVSTLFYLDLTFCCLFSSAFVFVVKPILKFVGTSSELMSQSFGFCIPILVGLPLMSLSSFGQFFLQSIGSSISSALVKIATYSLQLSILSPLFLFAIKVNVTFMKLGTIVANSIIGIIILALIFKGKFSLKPHFSNVFDKLSPELKTSVLNSIPLSISSLITIIPAMLILQSMTRLDSSQANSIAAVYAVFTQIYGISLAFTGAFSQGFISSATHAWGSNNTKRVLKLFLWVIVISVSFTMIVSLTILIGKTAILKLFIHDDEIVKLGEKFLPIPFYTSPLQGIFMPISLLMLVVGQPMLAFIPQCLQFLILCVGCNVLSATLKDAQKNMYVYNISDISVFVFTLFFGIVPYKIMKKKFDEENQMSQINSASLLE